MAKKKKPTYPEKVYVQRQTDEGDGSTWLTIFENPAGVAENNTTVEVAEYRFVGMKKVVNETKVE